MIRDSRVILYRHVQTHKPSNVGPINQHLTADPLMVLCHIAQSVHFMIPDHIVNPGQLLVSNHLVTSNHLSNQDQTVHRDQNPDHIVNPVQTIVPNHLAIPNYPVNQDQTITLDQRLNPDHHVMSESILSTYHFVMLDPPMNFPSGLQGRRAVHLVTLYQPVILKPILNPDRIQIPDYLPIPDHLPIPNHLSAPSQI